MQAIPFVTVSNAGNSADSTGFGAVAYDYAISKFDITIQQYVDFLNDVAATPTTPAVEALYDPDMSKQKVIEATITRTGAGTAVDPYVYAVAPGTSGNDPVIWVNWNQAARFANYLQNGATYGASTETGAYDFASGAAIPVRSADAEFWVPSEDEWYKAAYYDPASGAYTKYATQSDDLPIKEDPAGGQNSANYNGLRPELDKLTEVGAYTYSNSTYGTYDQSGLVWQWTDQTEGNVNSGFNKVVRGGSWSFGIAAIDSSTRRDYPTGDEQAWNVYKDDDTGFRIATRASTHSSLGSDTPVQLFDLVAQEQIGALSLAIMTQADSIGFEYWLDQLAGAAPGTALQVLRGIADKQALSGAAKEKYAAYADPAQATDAQIETLFRDQYASLFSFDAAHAPVSPTDAELATWVARFKTLASAGQPVGSLVVDLIASTETSDKAREHMALEFNAALQNPIQFSLTAPGTTLSVSYVDAIGGVYVDLPAHVTERGGAGASYAMGPASVSPIAVDALPPTVVNAVGSTFDDLLVGCAGSSFLSGGLGDDVLYGDSGQAAGNLASLTSLDGGSGSNRMYGGSAFNLFDVGDAAGGVNQVWGGASKMAGVAGFANNTISFAAVAFGSSVYVDLDNGHNAYINDGANNNGTYTLEDAIANVPNVVGSSGGDIILGDDATDRITGGGGGDALHAGAGQATFVYTGYGDSNLVTGYDSVNDFKIGIDRIDLTALQTDTAHLVIDTSGTGNAVYVEKVAGQFNASTDLAILVHTTTPGGLQAADFAF